MRLRICLAAMVLFSRLSLPSAGLSELPVANFFSAFKNTAIAVSPSGNRLLAIHPAEDTGRSGLIVSHLNTEEVEWLHVDEKDDVTWAAWAKPDRILLRLRGGIYSVHPDGGKAVQLVAPYSIYADVIQLPVGESDEMLVAIGDHIEASGLVYPHVYQMNVYTGRSRRKVVNRKKILEWLADSKGVVRIGAGIDADKFQVWHRSSEEAAWELLGQYGPQDDEITPLAFSDDPDILYVATRAGNDKQGVHRFNLKMKSLAQVVFSRPDVDVDDIVISRSGQLLGVRYVDEAPKWHWFIPALQHLQETADAAFPGHINELTSRAAAFDKVVIFSYSDRDPGSHYLYSIRTRTFERLWKIARHIDPSKMSEMKPIEYRARDGMTIKGYLTRPLGSSGTNLPLVVMPHGGPIARDEWGFNSQVQFLANRGYAVLQMNFRGSAGYGKAFLAAGAKQWGLSMQDDITDGVKWAVSEGVADPKRVAIFGSSYGGYAALMGLQTTPDLYQCGISLVAPVDLVETFHAYRPLNRYIGSWVTNIRGDPRKDKDLLQSVSPINHVSRLKAPVFLAWGKQDDRIPVKTARQFISKLKKEDKAFESTIYEGEGHTGWHDENDTSLHKDIEVFLKKHMPVRP